LNDDDKAWTPENSADDFKNSNSEGVTDVHTKSVAYNRHTIVRISDRMALFIHIVLERKKEQKVLPTQP